MKPKLTISQRSAVEGWLEYYGLWYPPDAIDAVYQGRDTYHALDHRVIWPTSRCEGPVRLAIEKACDNGWNPPR